MSTALRLVMVVICSLLFLSPSDAATTPSTPVEMQVEVVLKKIASLKVRELQQLTGRKMSLKEKLGFMVLKSQVRKGKADEMAGLLLKKIFHKHEPAGKVKGKKADGNKKAESAFVFGIAALVLLALGFFIPYVVIPSVISAILAIVLGTMAKKEGGSDSKASAGKLMGWITLGILVVLLIVAAIALSGWNW